MEYQHPVPPEVYTWVPPVVRSLETVGAGQPDSPRLLSIADEDRVTAGDVRPRLTANDPRAGPFARFRAVLRPNGHLLYGISSADGYDGGLLPSQAFTNLQRVLAGGADAPPSHFTLAMLSRDRADATILGQWGIGYLITDVDMAPPQGWRLVSRDGAVALYQHPAPAARVAIQRPGEAEAPAQIIRYEPEVIEVDVSAAAPATVIVRQTPYPGWQASVDGRAAALVPGDGLSVRVSVPSGAHLVRIWYDPWSWRAGLALSTATLILNGVLWWRRIRRPRRPRSLAQTETPRA